MSDDGKLFYSWDPENDDLLQLMWVSREGAETPVEPGWTFDASPTTGHRGWPLSPDGGRIAVKILTDLGPDIWIKQLANGALTRLTFFEGEDRFARWTPDGKAITFLSGRGGDLDVWSRPADGTGDAQLVLDTDGRLAEGFWSPDGEWLLLRTAGPGTGEVGGRDIYGFRPGVDSVPVPLVVTPYDEAGIAISDDGHWMAYQSNETGRKEIFVRPFPDVDRGKWQVSTGGGSGAVWAHSGREIFFLSGGELMVADVDPGPPFSVGPAHRLFVLGPGYYFANNTTSYDVTADDQTFLMARYADWSGSASFVLVNNFFEELKARVPGN